MFVQICSTFVSKEIQKLVDIIINVLNETIIVFKINIKVIHSGTMYQKDI